MDPITSIILVILGSILAIVVGVFAVVYLIVPLFKGLAAFIRHVYRFFAGEVVDIVRLLGAIVTALVYVPITLGSVAIGRWSGAAHFGRAIQGELGSAGLCLYRIVVAHPLRLIGLGHALEGVEKRLPEVVAAAPGADRPSSRTGQFPGYRVVGSLKEGGSGGKLYIAEPDPVKDAALERLGFGPMGQVVIKSFSLRDGSTLPQIVRESRSLDAAKRLGLILDHELSADRFFYVMRYIPGETLTVTGRRLHAAGEASGLSPAALRQVLRYTADLLEALSVYHRGGLWHKDVKPDNVIVDARTGRAELVDFGLVGALRSAMTLTTHGTEYFRDPDMVRMALRGAKVQDVDGTRFDIYGVGALLYALVEDSFPAHGVLSQVTRACPDSVKWIIRRAMTDYDKRYRTADDMLADVRAVADAANPFETLPADLPSVKAADLAQLPPTLSSPPALPAPGLPALASPAVASPALASPALAASANLQPLAAAPGWSKDQLPGRVESSRDPASVSAAASPLPPAPASSTCARVRVVNWWTGRAVVEPAAALEGHPVPRPDSARARAHALRARAQERAAGRRRPREPHAFRAEVNAGIAVALLIGIAVIVGLSTRGSRAPVAPAAPLVDVAVNGEPIALRDASSPGSTLPPTSTARTISPDTMSSESQAVLVNAGEASPLVGTPSSQVLFVSDLAQPWNSSALSTLRTIASDLSRQGLTPRGNIPLDAIDEARAASDVALIASCRLAMGQTSPTSADARAILVQWFDANPAAPGVVVWFAPDPADPKAPPRARVFSRTGADQAPAQRAAQQTGETLARALAQWPRP
jgi:serine/threonine protein kinase